MQKNIELINKKKATEEEMETYSYGKCMWFALAFHDLTGWQIQAILDENGTIEHSWIVTPDHHLLDIIGIDGPQDFIQFNPNGVQNFSRQQFINLIGNENEEELITAQNIILSLYELKNLKSTVDTMEKIRNKLKF